MTITESIEGPPTSGVVEGDVSEAPPAARRLDLGTFCGLAIALIGLGFGASRIADNSFFTHLATGREMLDSGIVRADVFTWTSQGEGLVVQSWLASLLYGGVDALGGFHALRLLTAVLGAVLAALSWRLTSSNPSIITRLGIMAPLLVIGHMNWTERPLLIAFVLFAVLLSTTEGNGRPQWLAVVGAVWVNVHGSWPLGIVYLVARILGGVADGGGVRRETASLKYLGLGVLVGGVLNPYGPAMLLFPIELLGRQEVLSHVVEWRSPSFDRLWTRAFLVLVFAAVAALMRRPRWRDALPMMVFVAAAFVGRRNIALASLVLLPVLAQGLPAIGRLAAARTSDAIRLGCVAMGALLFVIPTIAMPSPDVDVARYPEAAITAMEDELGLAPGETRIIHQDFVGNYLDLRYGDSAAAWIDDRFELHAPALVSDYLVLLDGRSGWDEVLERYDAEAIVWRGDSAIVQLARDAGGWSTVWSDDTWVVLCAPGHPAC